MFWLISIYTLFMVSFLLEVMLIVKGLVGLGFVREPIPHPTGCINKVDAHTLVFSVNYL